MSNELSSAFTPIDWIVVVVYMVFTTWLGHKMSGHQSSIKDFFLGGRTLPWWAVSGSIIATEISGVTFIGVPGMVMAAQGDFTYLLWGIGSIMGRIIVGQFFVKVFYEDEIYSPYDYMGRRIKPQLKTLATVFFTVGAILGQSVRVLVAALPLKVVTGLPIEVCIGIIGVIAVCWTMMGGMRTVIWTDVIQFCLFTIGGLIALFWIVTHLDAGWSEFWSVADAAGKTKIWDARMGIGNELQFTFWVAVIAVPFQNLTAFGVDQLNAQRMFCCRSVGDAKKAIIWSSVGQVLTFLMLMVGAGLYVFYSMNPPAGYVADALQFNEAGVPAKGDLVFPVWIVTQLPVGLSGLILAGIFAASISSLDSILAALSQTTLSLFHKGDSGALGDAKNQESLVKESRKWVMIWGVVLTCFTLMLYYVKDEIPILSLAFGMTSYTMGPLLAMFLCALIGKGSYRGLFVGSVISFILVLFVRMDIWILVSKAGLSIDWLTALPTYAFNENGNVTTTVGYFWMWPVTTVLTVLVALMIREHRKI